MSSVYKEDDERKMSCCIKEEGEGEKENEKESCSKGMAMEDSETITSMEIKMEEIGEVGAVFESAACEGHMDACEGGGEDLVEAMLEEEIWMQLQQKENDDKIWMSLLGEEDGGGGGEKGDYDWPSSPWRYEDEQILWEWSWSPFWDYYNGYGDVLSFVEDDLEFPWEEDLWQLKTIMEIPNPYDFNKRTNM